MKTKHFVLTILCLFSVSGTAFGDRQLERAEILQIFQKLTSQPRKTWISTGTIQATHEEYRAPKTTNQNEIDIQVIQAEQEYLNNPNKREKTEDLQIMRFEAIEFNVKYRLSNEYTMNSSVEVKYDGERFSWEINVNSRTDSVKPGPDLEENYMTRNFRLDWNGRRRFTWDGDKYTIYSLSGNNSIEDTTGSIPHVVNGPLTAGIVPWGYDLYTYQNLSAAASSAIEKNINGQTQIHLTLENFNGSEMLFVLDAGNDYAVLSNSIEINDKSISRQYDNYRLVSGVQVPMTILIEEHDGFTNRLLASDLWHITSISGVTPSAVSFNVDYQPDALIEYNSNVTRRPALYSYSYTLDMDRLLTERLDYAATEKVQARNCATAAMKYVASQLGKKLNYKQLAQLVNRSGGATSLKTMRDFAQRCGLYCRAVRTDIQTLKSLSGCRVILHIPPKNHFVVLGDIDNQYVWSIDLARDKFCYRTDISFFDKDWSEGIALLVSDSPITNKFHDIDEDELRGITGGAGYTCTNLLQEVDVEYCGYEPSCSGYWSYYPERWGCEAAESGSCTSSFMIYVIESPCVLGSNFLCAVTGDWDVYYGRACD